MTIERLVLIAGSIYLTVLVGAIYFTRANRRRVVGALAGGVAVAVVGVGVEVLCQRLGFWRYPSTDAPYGPPMMYPVIVVLWSIYTLIGWRVIRRFGWRGEAVFLTAVTAIGTLRDYLIAGQALGVISLAPGISTMLVDAICWAGLTALAQAVMRFVAGPAGADRLARRPSDAG